MISKNTLGKEKKAKLIQTLVGCRAEALFLLKVQTTFVESKENSNETKANPNKLPTNRNEVYS